MEPLLIQTALIHDGVLLLAESLKQLGPENIKSKEINCNKIEMSWQQGNSISNFMRNVSHPRQCCKKEEQINGVFKYSYF